MVFESILLFLFSSMLGIALIPLLIIGGVFIVILSVRHYRKIPSPKESKQAFLRFEQEIAELQKEGFIIPEQQEMIKAKYQKLEPQREALRRQKMVTLFAIFGAVLIGSGVILLIAANWSKLPSFVATFILILSVLAVYVLAWWLRFKKENHPRVASALIFLGSLLFGASLILTAQIYHIRIEFSNLILIWALSILPMAYFTKSHLSSVLSVFLIFGWGLFSLVIPSFIGGDVVFPLRYYISLILVLGLMMPLAYRLKSLSVQALSLAGIMVWLAPLAALKWFQGSSSITLDLTFLYLALAGAFLLLGELHFRVEAFKKFKNIYYLIGLWTAFSALLLLTFPAIHNIGKSFATGQLTNTSFMPVFFNFILFAAICAVIYLGIRREENVFVNMSIFFFAVLVCARYFSVSWGLSGRAVIFIIGGLLLFAGSWLIDWTREKLLHHNNDDLEPVSDINTSYDRDKS